MPDNRKMQRVNKENPCPVCGKPDWCLVAKDGSAAICQRIQDGSVRSCGDAGYLHVLAGHHKDTQYRSQQRFAIKQNVPGRDFTVLQRQYRCQVTGQQLDNLSQRLGVSTQSLKRLCVGWDGKAYTFPMKDAGGKTIGIRRRFSDGHKLSAKGSKTGLFIPANLSFDGLLLICEGPTDTASALDLDFDAIGRPNCNSKVDMTARFAKGRAVVIIGDNDEVGKTGAEKLAGKLAFICPSVQRVFAPSEYKDIRNWYRAGLSRNELLTVIENTKPITMELR